MPPEGGLEALYQLIARLRQECPWDREQTHSSLRANLLEECYEVLEALDQGDPHRLCQELGDLLMQVFLHARIAQEAGEFTLEEVVANIQEKLIRRHPHVFGGPAVTEARQVLDQWDRLKEEEGVSLLDRVPRSLPALAYSQEVQERASRQGFDWETASGVLEKLAEEVQEVMGASSPRERAREFGDLLFTLVNLGRKLGLDTESVLRETNQRFVRRFLWMTQACARRGLSFPALSPQEKEALWEEAKRLEDSLDHPPDPLPGQEGGKVE